MDPIFYHTSLQEFLSKKLLAVRKSLMDKDIASDNIEILKSQLLNAYTLDKLVLKTDKTENRQVKAVRKMRGRSFPYDGMRYSMPFSGSAILFQYSPAQKQEKGLMANVTADMLEFDIMISGNLSSESTQENISSEALRAVALIQSNIDAVNAGVQEYNAQLPAVIEATIQQRLQDISGQNNIIKSTNPFKKP